MTIYLVNNWLYASALHPLSSVARATIPGLAMWFADFCFVLFSGLFVCLFLSEGRVVVLKNTNVFKSYPIVKGSA